MDAVGEALPTGGVRQGAKRALCFPGGVSVAGADSGSRPSRCAALAQATRLLPARPARRRAAGDAGLSAVPDLSRSRPGAGKPPGTSSVHTVTRWPRRAVGICISKKPLVTAKAAGPQSHPAQYGSRPAFLELQTAGRIGTGS